MYKIAVMGDYDSIYGFSALGLDIYPFESKEESAKMLRQLAEGEYGIIYITEELAEMLSNENARYAARPLPSIIQIPGVKGNTGDGIRGVKKTVEQAVGSDILFGEDR